MTEEIAITIPDDVRAAFMAFDDDYLADVLRLWDCDLKCWHDPYMIVFRFESEDVMVWSESSVLRHCAGAVDTSALAGTLPKAAMTGIDSDACLCWLRDTRFNSYIGSAGTSSDLLTSIV